MTTFALVHGAWHGAWFWQPLSAALRERGHNPIAVELPADDPTAGFRAYVDVAVQALAGARGDPVVVGHSLGGLTIPLIADAQPVSRLVFLSAMVPEPGVSVADQLGREPEMFAPSFEGAPARDDSERSWWPDAAEAIGTLYPDCPRDLAEWAAARLRPQGRLPNTEPCPLTRWPEVESAYVLGRQDAVIDPAWARRTARERLGVEPVELPGGHSLPLSRPAELADALTAYA